MNSSETLQCLPPLKIALDAGHSSIGWAVLSCPENADYDILGTGVVTFEADSALAITRRGHRQQRRHVRATRQRIARIEQLLIQQGAMTPKAITLKHRANGGNVAPWLLAAKVLATGGKDTLSWPELWDVLRWYAHNRGYEDMTAGGKDVDDDDTLKVEDGKRALAEYGTHTMAETVCKMLGQDPLAPRTGTTVSYKRRNCAFERPLIASEVLQILAAHLGKLPGVDEALVATLMLDARAIPLPGVTIPKRFHGGLLFGRLCLRYDNRIIRTCPITNQKTPSKSCSEFLSYRWAMQLANIRITTLSSPSRPLTADERCAVHAAMCARGHLGVKDLKKAVRDIPGVTNDNLDQMLVHPDAKDALVLDPVKKLITGNREVSGIWPTLPVQLQKRLAGQWQKGKAATLAAIGKDMVALKHPTGAFDRVVDELFASLPKPRGKNLPLNREQFLTQKLSAREAQAKLSGRAPYARHLLSKALDDVLAGKDPKASGGALEETGSVKERRSDLPLDAVTNNHLIRHRLQIMERLLKAIIADPAFGNGSPDRFTHVVIEVNRDMQTMSGLTAKQIESELNDRLRGHKRVSEFLAEALPPGTPITASLIRKAIIADDLGWCCPYTGAHFDPIDLVSKQVDKDHIVPRADRPSDAMASLAITFSTVNRMKGKRTAMQFVAEFAGRPVEGEPGKTIVTPKQFEAFVNGLNVKGHEDDRRRKKARKDWFLMANYTESERTFTDGALTQTSQLGRLAAHAINRVFKDTKKFPQVVSLPGAVTGAVRKAWKVLGCLSLASPSVLEPDGTLKTKTEIRDITHLHHALDACVLALTAHCIPNRGNIWKLLCLRRLNELQKAELSALGLFDFNQDGHFVLREMNDRIKEQIRHRVAERRVVQHVPADMSGILVEANTRGIIAITDGFVHLRQRGGYDPKTGTYATKAPTKEPVGKVIGLNAGSKLAAVNGVRVIEGNYGVAILDDTKLPPDERFVIIPHERVWQRLQDLKARNGGKKPMILRNGMLIDVPTGRYQGRWKIRMITKNMKLGILINMSLPDYVMGNVSGVSECKMQVNLASLVSIGITQVPGGLLG